MGFHDRGLASIRIHREQGRFVDQRSEERQSGLVENATIYFRGEAFPVPVINISSRGTMIECGLSPRIGESMIVEFEHCSRIHAFVRWIRDGRIGLNFGHELVLAETPARSGDERRVEAMQPKGRSPVPLWIASLRSQ